MKLLEDNQFSESDDRGFIMFNKKAFDQGFENYELSIIKVVEASLDRLKEGLVEGVDLSE